MGISIQSNDYKNQRRNFFKQLQHDYEEKQQRNKKRATEYGLKICFIRDAIEAIDSTEQTTLGLDSFDEPQIFEDCPIGCTGYGYGDCISCDIYKEANKK